MRKNSRTHLLPVAIFPAILPALVVPILRNLKLPDYVVGATMGFCIGLAIVGIAFMLEIGRCSTDG